MIFINFNQDYTVEASESYLFQRYYETSALAHLRRVQASINGIGLSMPAADYAQMQRFTYQLLRAQAPDSMVYNKAFAKRGGGSGAPSELQTGPL